MEGRVMRYRIRWKVGATDAQRMALFHWLCRNANGVRNCHPLVGDIWETRIIR